MQVAASVAGTIPVISTADDLKNSSHALAQKSKLHSPENTVSCPSEAHSTQSKRQSAGGNDELSVDITDKVDETLTDSCMSPELHVVSSLPAARRTRTAVEWGKITSLRTNRRMKSYSLRRRRSTGDENRSGVSVPDLAKFLTPPQDTSNSRTSDVYDFQSDGNESPLKLKGHRSGDENCEVEAVASDSDSSVVFPLPPQITRICTDLEFLKSDGRKRSDVSEDGGVTSELKKRSGSTSGVRDNSNSNKVPDIPVSGRRKTRSAEGNSTVTRVSDVPEKPWLSRLRRASESRCNDGEVSNIIDGQRSRQRRTETSSDVQRDSPVSSRLRNRSDDKSATDGKDLPSVEVVTVSPTKLFPPLQSNAMLSASSSGIELGSQAKCSQPKSNLAVESPTAVSNCGVVGDTSFPMTVGQSMTSPKISPVLPGSPRISGSGQPQRASFRLVVNLQSPKSERIRRQSSDTLSLEDTDTSSDVQKRPICPGCQSPRRIRRTSLSPSSPSKQRHSPSVQPGSDRKLRPRPQKDAPVPKSETTTRRSLRLVMKNTDVTSGSTQVATADTFSGSTSNR